MPFAHARTQSSYWRVFAIAAAAIALGIVVGRTFSTAGAALVGTLASAGIGTGLLWWWWRNARQDIDSRALAQDAVLLHATESILSTDVAGNVATMSRGAEALFGYNCAEGAAQVELSGLFEGPATVELNGNPAPGASAFRQLADATLAAGDHHECEWICRRRSGATFPARVSVTALRSAAKALQGYLIVVSDLSVTYAVERQRRETDARMTKIASQVPGMVFQFQQFPDGRRCMPYVSDGIRTVFGVEPAAVAQDIAPVWSTFHPEDVVRVEASVVQSAESLKPWQCEFRARRADGDVRWLWGNSQPERQPDGSVLWHGFIADVTERKRAEQQHDESRAVLQSILASVDLAVFLVDVGGDGEFRFVEINPAYERLTGITADEIRGRTPNELVPVIPAEMAACLRASFRRGMDASGPVEYEEPFFVRGRLFWWLTRLVPLRDPAGKVVRLVGRSLDITERKAVEVRVQSLTERLQLATEAAQFGIWDFDLIQQKLVWDARMLALYGLTASTFDGTMTAWHDRIHPEDRARAEREYREAVDGRKPYHTSFRVVWPDGSEREIRARAHVQRNPAGRAVRVVGVHWDVTAERRAQADIELARDRAEDLNRQLEDALERAHRLAQDAAAATVAKSEFLANMSHEIRTPLNAIIGMSGLLLGTQLDKDQQEFAETIRSSGDGLLTLVNDILDYSKIESGRLELEQQPFDLRECIEASVDVLSGRAAEKKLDLIYSIDSGIPECIEGDVTRLRQVIVNLLSNAVKFTSRGEVYLAVHQLAAADSNRVRLRFAVHDSGIGIPADRMDRLFKTFSQVDASTTRQFGGTGLGLAISKRIIEVMGGRIWVESTAGKGSTFCFEVEVPAVAAPLKPFAAGRIATLAGRKLLIVDDNPTCCRVLCQQAVAWGLMPRAVGSAAEASALLQRGERFDLALIEFDLPGKSGPSLLAEIRRLVPAAEMPVAYLTVPALARPSGADAVVGSINKPIKTAALFELVGQMLRGQVTARIASTEAAANLAQERPLSILLAEDNPVNQRVAVLMLQRLGYRADVVGNGRDAVAAVERHRYDLILMDVQMPEMDGVQATEEICARLSPAARPRIVAMTANASLADRDRCLRAGMSDFLTKPVRAEDLRRALEETPLPAALTVA